VYLQDPKQPVDGDRRVALDEINHPVVRPAKSIGGQDGVWLAREIAISKEQQLQRLAHFFVSQKRFQVGCTGGVTRAGTRGNERGHGLILKSICVQKIRQPY